MANMRGMMTVRQAAEGLGLSIHTLRAWIYQRRIGVVRLGRSVRIPTDEIERLLERGFVPAVQHSSSSATYEKKAAALTAATTRKASDD